MSNTIQHDWQYKTLMLASIKDSKHFTRSCMVYSRMQIGAVIARVGNKQTINYYYVPALNQYDGTDNDQQQVKAKWHTTHHQSAAQ